MDARTLLALGALAAIGACSFPPITFQDEPGGSTTTTTSSGGGASTTTTSSASMGGSAGMGGMGTAGGGGAPVTSSTTGNGGTGGVDCTNPDGDHDGHDAVECGGDDCDDGDDRAYPGQTDYFSTERKTKGGYNFDCDPDGNETPLYGTTACNAIGQCPLTDVFIASSPVPCGQSNNFGDCATGLGCTIKLKTPPKEACH